MIDIAGICSILIPLYRGDPMIILPAFDPEVFLEIVEREKVNTTYLVPTMLQAVLDHPDFTKRDTSSLRHIGYGACYPDARDPSFSGKKRPSNRIHQFFRHDRNHRHRGGPWTVGSRSS